MLLRSTTFARRLFSTRPKPTATAHPKDKVAETPEEIKAINEAVRHIPEEDLEHDALGMKQHPHHEMNWKEAEAFEREQKDKTVPQLEDK
jgi:hypothetical protein